MSCAGSVDAILPRTGQALEVPYEELLDHVRGAPALNVDETGCRLRGAQRTLWGAFTQRVAVFSVAGDRHEQRLRELLGEHRGSSPPIAGGPMTTSRWGAARCAGRTYSATSRPTPRALAPSVSSASTALGPIDAVVDCVRATCRGTSARRTITAAGREPRERMTAPGSIACAGPRG